MEKLLALLVESGVVYCGIWVSVIVPQPQPSFTKIYDINRTQLERRRGVPDLPARLLDDLPGPSSTNDVEFLNISSALLSGALVPAIVRLVFQHTHTLCRSYSSSLPPSIMIPIPQAICPVFIVALIALNRSHIEKGFT